MLDIKSGENSAHISFMTEFYNRVHENDASYDYDYGLYIDCTVFEITVHAPISALYADVKTELDFDVAKAEKASISLERGVKDGNIYNIDSSELFLTCSGTSDFKISGRVSGYARIMAFHDAHIDARDLFIKDGTLHISRAIGGFSYILRGKPARVPINIDVFGAANFIEAFVFIPPVIWAVMLLRAIIKKKSQNKESNTTVS